MRRRGRLGPLMLAGVLITVGTLGLGSPAQTAPTRDVTTQKVAPQAGPGPGAGTQAFGAFYLVTNEWSNKCPQSMENSVAANALVVQKGCGGISIVGQWALLNVGNGYYWLLNRLSGMCLDLQANSEAEVRIGTLVQQFWCSIAYTTEQWRLLPAPVPSGYYLLQNRVKGLCADVKNRSTAEDAQLQVIECKPNEPAQHFRFA